MLIIMRYYNFILSTMMVTLCILGLISPVQGHFCNIVVSPEIQDVMACNEFTIDIMITDLNVPMTDFGFRVEWDENLMELRKSEEHLIATWTIIISMDGVDYYHLEASGAAYGVDHSWVTLTFHCKGEGFSDIVFTYCSIEEEGLEFMVDVGGGFVFQHSAVGGYYATVNKPGILAPYLALIGLIGVASALAIRKWCKG